jgi:hypothetical protein
VSPSVPMVTKSDRTFGNLTVTCGTSDEDRKCSYDIGIGICKRASSLDGEPVFTNSEPETLSASTSSSWRMYSLEDIRDNEDADCYSIDKSEDLSWWETHFHRSTTCKYITFEFTIISHREMSDAQWQYLTRPRSSPLNLLEKAERTGDVMIVAKVRSSDRHARHSEQDHLQSLNICLLSKS